MEIKFLGTASGLSVLGHSHTAIVLGRQDHFYIFDCGESATQGLLKASIPWHKIKAIFISHMHVDHFSGLFQLLQSMQLSHRKEPLTIFLPYQGKKWLEDSLPVFLLNQELLPFPLALSTIREGLILNDGIIKVYAIPNSHLQTYGRESFSFQIKTDKRNFVYSGDLKSIEDLHWINHPDLLVVEVAHIKLEDIFRFLEEKNIPRAAITHFHPLLNLELASNSGKACLNRKIIFAKEGLSISP